MKFKLLASSVLMSGVFALSGAFSVANANLLTIVDSLGNPALAPTTYPYNNNAEAIGDPGGTNHANPPTPGASAGSGMPTAGGGWPVGPGFAKDPSFGDALGISGWDGSYLKLEQAGDVTFQFTGKGDASDHDIFQLFLDGAWATVWDNQSASNGTCDPAGTSPTCVFPPKDQQSFFLNAGLIAFQFVNKTNPATVTNFDPLTGLSNNPKDIAAGYFLGMDPYLVSGSFQNSGSAAYAGLTDRADGDHDYEDLVVRISVPEPGILALLMAGLLGFGVLRRRQAASDAVGLLA